MVSEPLVRLRDVAFAYDATRPVVDGVELELWPGERLAIAGGNGAGKTTLLHLLVGLLRPTRGEVFAFGRLRHEERDFHEVRIRAALMFQDADDQLFCPTVREDVSFGPLNLGRSRVEATAAADAMLDRLGLAALADRVTYHLSGGEKRMVAFAGLLAMEPDVLLLDEPTSGLDDRARVTVVELLQRLPQAMILVTHDREVRTRLATRTIVLTEGRLHPSPE